MSSGCSSVGRAVTSDTIDQRFEFRHQQNIIKTHLLPTVEKSKINEKEAGKWPFL